MVPEELATVERYGGGFPSGALGVDEGFSSTKELWSAGCRTLAPDLATASS